MIMAMTTGILRKVGLSGCGRRGSSCCSVLPSSSTALGIGTVSRLRFDAGSDGTMAASGSLDSWPRAWFEELRMQQMLELRQAIQQSESSIGELI
ncbi:hypothetical protein MLD38_010025 [Melastoma candidum]|uniref:Uncharacterized protein n=1 Tax=Melastoma candidum TaxID=119954 RepID=A0ACB9R2K2_9MYRT|nr:hypothetical protein MLD38_010025 [Melastoma candidum]